MQNLFINIDIGMNVGIYVCTRAYVHTNLSKQRRKKNYHEGWKFFINQGIKEVGFSICLEAQ